MTRGPSPSRSAGSPPRPPTGPCSARCRPASLGGERAARGRRSRGRGCPARSSRPGRRSCGRSAERRGTTTRCRRRHRREPGARESLRWRRARRAAPTRSRRRAGRRRSGCPPRAASARRGRGRGGSRRRASAAGVAPRRPAGRIAFRIAMTAAARIAAGRPLTAAPGRIAAAISRASAERNQLRRSWAGFSLGRSGCHCFVSTAAVAHPSRSSPIASRPFDRLDFISLALSLASVYESFTSLEPPLQPKTMQISTTAKTTLNAVVTSCCPIE